MKIIIIGAGEVGFNIAQRLSEENHDVVVIDKDQNRINQLQTVIDVQAIVGSGTSPSILQEAGIKETDIIVAATDSDEANLIACFYAQHLTDYITKIARVRNPDYMQQSDVFKTDALNIDLLINPQSEMVGSMLKLMEVPEASEVLDFVNGKVKLIGVTVKEDSPLVGRKLASFQDVEEVLLVGVIIRGEEVIIPSGKDVIQPNDLLYCVTRKEEISTIFRLLNVREAGLGRIVIVGGGTTGLALATSLDKTNINTKIIEKDSQRCLELAEKLEKVVVLNGDGTDRDFLLEENIADVDLMVVITGDEETNVLISLLGKALGAKKTVTRIGKLSYIPLVSAIGIDTVVSPRLSAIRAILQYIRKGKVVCVAPLKGETAEVIEFEALETSDIVNTPLSEVKFPKEAIIGAIVRDEEIIIPRGHNMIKPHDHLIIFALKGAIPKLEKLFTVKLEYF
ncbi:MAG: Trk system potassium transporter TrkA [Deltaproteobacteria bacterium]|nr:MAG: Trk system potassium transporter TrkA [Deltaproteobacteria bacterium]